ncbi:MAG TPA: glycoside hydrolase family 43 protein [Candidatus Limnocylindrales bacterium]|nr:glycoside hydrolase family 43 protein [Candidatus Limnocylindrales bacterium]
MTSKTYINPVYDGYFADPFVLRHRTGYYAYGTNDRVDATHAFEVLRSDDLVSWSSLGRALPAVEGLRACDHWAPEVAEHEGRFYMYFSAGVDDREHALRVAVADRPEGPFSTMGGSLTPHERFAIDASPFRDDDGQWYLYYARDWLEGERVGTSLVVDRLVGMDRLAGEPVPVLGATADWQLYRRQRQMYGKVYDWHTLEGPFVVKRLGRYWCLYSGGAWTSAGYGVSWAVADHPLGPFSEPLTDGPALLRTRPGQVLGPGHNSVVVGPDGQDYLVYHAWDSAQTARRMFIDRLDWTEEGPLTAAPTTTAQPAPERPSMLPEISPDGSD